MSTTAWWILGFAVAGVVVLVAATLLITIILLARRIANQAAAITLALDGAMRNTNPLFDLASMNHALESISRGVAKLRGHSKGLEDERNLLDRMRSKLPGRGP